VRNKHIKIFLITSTNCWEAFPLSDQLIVTILALPYYVQVYTGSTVDISEIQLIGQY